MRILQIRFRNLNSLAGDWLVDLTDPAYTADGIFAITGPTGAGKSTILDAVCLALYGRTPRLPRVNKSGNEIMTRQTGDCFAEVVFETQSGRYRCSWSQHRARRNAEGELQAPQHEISNAHTGEVFETSIRGVAGQIEAATGMDFDRFTRSMLLAQGGFAVFLQAAPDDRAPILEQITGTAIYSDISKQVHVLRSEKQKNLELLQAELSGMEPLSEEEEQRLVRALKENREKDQAQSRRIEKLDQSIQWLDGIRRLKEDLLKIRSDKERMQQQVAAFAPQQDRLDAALRALELDGTYAVLSGHRSEQQKEQASLDDDRMAQPVVEERVLQERTAHQAAGEKRNAAQSELQKQRPVLQSVREMDIQAAERARQILGATEELDRRKNTASTYRKNLEEAENRQSELLKQAEELQAEQERARADAGLVENLTGLRSRIDALLQLSKEQATRNTARDEAAQALKRAADQLKEAEEQHAKTTAAWNTCRDALQNTDAERRTLLDGQEAAAWRSGKARHIERRNALADARETQKQRQTLLLALADNQKRRTDLQTQEKNAADRIRAQEEQQKILEARLETMDQKVALLRDVQDLDDLRTRLQDGKPCPLCGATDHPYAAGQVPAVAEAEKERTELNTKLQKLREQLGADTVAHARCQTEIRHLETELESQAEAEHREREKLVAQLRLLDPEQKHTADDPELEDWLDREREQAVRAAELATEQTTRLDELDAVREQRQQETAAARDVADKAERAYQEIRHVRDAAEQEVRRIGTGIEELQTQLQSVQAKVWDELAAYGVANPTMETVGDALEQLTRRRDAWTRMSQDLVTIEREKASLYSRIGPLNEALEEAVKALEAQGAILERLHAEQQALQEKRAGLLGDGKPDEEEARLTEAVEKASDEVEKSRTAVEAAERDLEQIRQRITDRTASIQKRAEILGTEESRFAERLQKTGFGTEEDYRQACLPEEERKRLSEQAKNLSSEQGRLDALEKERDRQLVEETEKSVTDRPLEEIQIERAQQMEQLRGLQQEIGGMEQRLRDNTQLKTKKQEQLKAIQALQSECARWDRLHALIGSSDGKKYRNFAQGITFEMMVGHANRQLRKMSDRYLLVRDPEQPLELNVVDNYQAGEIRSTKNLSGGESFIVSLALALGLSGMASRNVRVDSLFLDEGFGTLDEEALDVALETLSGLQQEGKLIGIISHVSALRERIGTRIRVVPRTGGRSRIEGPGCSRGEK